jgi:hypothetical protein
MDLSAQFILRVHRWALASMTPVDQACRRLLDGQKSVRWRTIIPQLRFPIRALTKFAWITVPALAPN